MSINVYTPTLPKVQILKKKIKCHFCNENHTCRQCPLELEISPFLKKKVGASMEHYIGNNFKCRYCDNPLKVIGNHSPSLDIICTNLACDIKIEVKSKCLSIAELPEDIRLPHGNYKNYLERLDEKLELIVIIYGVDRNNKVINIREILYVPYDILKNANFIEVKKRPDTNLSEIKIKNRTLLHNLVIPKGKETINFNNDIITFLKNKKN